MLLMYFMFLMFQFFLFLLCLSFLICVLLFWTALLRYYHYIITVSSPYHLHHHWSPYHHCHHSIRCGRVLIQLARDHEQTRPQIKASFAGQIEALCGEAKRIQRNIPIREEPSLDSPRVQILQRFTNLCVVMENMASEGRRQTNDLIKELVSEEMIELLVRSFTCTLPPSRQLLGQLR